MLWPEIRTAYPVQWLIIEDLDAHTTAENQRLLDWIAIIESCPDGSVAMQRYRLLHQQHLQREFYFIHTSRQELDIRERQWLGIRRGRRKSSHVGKASKRNVGGTLRGFPKRGNE